MRSSRIFLVLAALAASSLVAVPAMAVGEPTVTIAAPSDITGSFVFTFDQDVTGVSGDNVVLRYHGTTTNLGSSLSCRTGSGAAVSCGALTGVRAVTLRPASILLPGRYYRVYVNPAGADPVTSLTGSPAITTNKGYRAYDLQESTAVASYQWRRVSTSSAYGGSYRSEKTAGAWAILSFTGRSITWYTKTGPYHGRALVYVDGVKRLDVNNYSSTDRHKVARRITGLSSGAHRLTIRVRGVKGSTRGRGTWIAVDGFRSDAGWISQNDARYGWSTVRTAKASGGRYLRSGATNARATVRFWGKGVDWYTTMGPDHGKAAVYVDGVKRKTVDLYASSRRYGVRVSIAALSEAAHTLMIVPLGTKRSASTGTLVSVDRFILRLPSITVFRKLGAWIDLWDYGRSITSDVASMRAHGVKTLYIQTARWNSDADIANPSRLGAWLDAATAEGIAVVGWYLPAYDQWLDRDVRRTVAIAGFRSSGGNRFDGLAVDIEYKGETETRNPNSEFNDGIRLHLARVRAGVGLSYPIGAIVPSPVGMSLSPSSWTGFPWTSIGRYADVVMPMGYWSYRLADGRCPAQDRYCAYRYTLDNIAKARSLSGLPVHEVGGVAKWKDRNGAWHYLPDADMTDFARACTDAAAVGCSIYDNNTMRASQWDPLEALA